MTGFKIVTKEGTEISFHFYLDDAPVTSTGFQHILPFTRKFYHARVSGQEIWIDDVPSLDLSRKMPLYSQNQEKSLSALRRRPGLKRQIALGYTMERAKA